MPYTIFFTELRTSENACDAVKIKTGMLVERKVQNSMPTNWPDITAVLK